MWGSTGSKIQKSWEFKIRVFKMIKSGFYQTNLEQNNSPELLNLLLNTISHKHGTIFVYRLLARPLMATTHVKKSGKYKTRFYIRRPSMNLLRKVLHPSPKDGGISCSCSSLRGITRPVPLSLGPLQGKIIQAMLGFFPNSFLYVRGFSGFILFPNG